MKKFLLSALAIVAFAGSGFASNEVVSEITEIETVTTSVEEAADLLLSNRPCEYSVVAEDSKGNLLEWVIGSGPEGGRPCLELVMDAVMYLNRLYPEATISIDIIAM